MMKRTIFVLLLLSLLNFSWGSNMLEHPVYTEVDVVCVDADGDGYYYWGTGNKPADCPSWVPDDPDSDDSDINIGPLDQYGNPQVLLPFGITINSSVTYSSNFTLSNRIGIVTNGILTITSNTTMASGAIIRVCENGTLVIDGGTINNTNLILIPGCHVIIRNDGTINMASGIVFNAPKGVVVDIESGAIN